jgi:hypothetical protein
VRQAFGVQVVPDGQVQAPELLAGLELGGVYRLAVGGQDAAGVQPLAGGRRGYVPGHRAGAGVLEVVPDPAGIGGHQVARAGVAVQGAGGKGAEFGLQAGVGGGQGGRFGGRDRALRAGQVGRDVLERGEDRELAGIVGQLGVQVAQHRADDVLTGQDAPAKGTALGSAGWGTAGRAHVCPEGHDLAVAMVDGGGDFRAWCHHRGASVGQELDDV